MKALYKMEFSCGRNGDLEGIFVADTEDVKYLVDKKISVYFGEVLGKHSEVTGCVDKKEIKKITTDKNVIKVFEDHDLECGYNPFGYTLCECETDDVPENGVEWCDCTVGQFIDFKRKGIVPKYYLESYNEFMKAAKNNDHE